MADSSPRADKPNPDRRPALESSTIPLPPRPPREDGPPRLPAEVHGTSRLERVTCAYHDPSAGAVSAGRGTQEARMPVGTDQTRSLRLAIGFWVALLPFGCSDSTKTGPANGGSRRSRRRGRAERHGSLPLSQRLSGSVRAKNQVDVYPEISAIVADVLVGKRRRCGRGRSSRAAPLLGLRGAAEAGEGRSPGRRGPGFAGRRRWPRRPTPSSRAPAPSAWKS